MHVYIVNKYDAVKSFQMTWCESTVRPALSPWAFLPAWTMPRRPPRRSSPPSRGSSRENSRCRTSSGEVRLGGTRSCANLHSFVVKCIANPEIELCRWYQMCGPSFSMVLYLIATVLNVLSERWPLFGGLMTRQVFSYPKVFFRCATTHWFSREYFSATLWSALLFPHRHQNQMLLQLLWAYAVSEETTVACVFLVLWATVRL